MNKNNTHGPFGHISSKYHLLLAAMELDSTERYILHGSEFLWMSLASTLP